MTCRSTDGRKLYLAGLDRRGWLSLEMVSDNDTPADLPGAIGGTDPASKHLLSACCYAFNGEGDGQWPTAPLAAGDEVIVRVLPPGPADPPGEFESVAEEEKDSAE